MCIRYSVPAAWVQSGDETREDISTGATIRRLGTITYRVVGFVKGSSLDTARNEMVEAIEEVLDTDRKRGGFALDTQVAVSYTQLTLPTIYSV